MSKRWCKLCCLVYPEQSEENHMKGARHRENVEKVDYLTSMSKRLWEKRRTARQIAASEIKPIKETLHQLSQTRK